MFSFDWKSLNYKPIIQSRLGTPWDFLEEVLVHLHRPVTYLLAGPRSYSIVQGIVMNRKIFSIQLFIVWFWKFDAHCIESMHYYTEKCCHELFAYWHSTLLLSQCHAILFYNICGCWSGTVAPVTRKAWLRSATLPTGAKYCLLLHC